MDLLDPKYFQIALTISRAYPELVWARVAAASVAQKFFGPITFPVSAASAADGKPAAVINGLADSAAEAWTLLAKAYGGLEEPFPNIHALLFFLETLSLKRKLLYRGQVNGEWRLETTLARSVRNGVGSAAIARAKNGFLKAVEKLPDRRHLGLSGGEPEALCQHYGFPTDYLDFTWSLETAGFFALGGDERYRRPVDPPCATAAIWALDVMGLDRNDGIELVSLPAQVMRPWLQRGEFLNVAATKRRIKIVKFLFRHHADIWVDALANLGPYSSTPLSMFLFPRRDPLADAATPFLDQLKE
jgi:hypothetical protein